MKKQSLSIREHLAFPSILLATGVASSGCLLTSPLDKSGKIYDLITKNWARFVARAAGMKVSAVNVDIVDRERTYVVIANHQSHMDVIALTHTSPVPLRMLAKDDLFSIPVFGPALKRSGHIAVHRGRQHHTHVSDLFGDIERLIQAKRSIMVFPEGSRSLDGHIGSFKKGAFVIARHFELPILPIAISGTREILPSKSIKFHAGHARLVYHQPIETGDINLEKLIEKTHQTLEKTLAQN